jgi:hypothetical protein
LIIGKRLGAIGFGTDWPKGDCPVQSGEFGIVAVRKTMAFSKKGSVGDGKANAASNEVPLL